MGVNDAMVPLLTAGHCVCIPSANPKLLSRDSLAKEGCTLAVLENSLMSDISGLQTVPIKFTLETFIASHSEEDTLSDRIVQQAAQLPVG